MDLTYVYHWSVRPIPTGLEKGESEADWWKPCKASVRMATDEKKPTPLPPTPTPVSTPPTPAKDPAPNAGNGTPTTKATTAIKAPVTCVPQQNLGSIKYPEADADPETLYERPVSEPPTSPSPETTEIDDDPNGLWLLDNMCPGKGSSITGHNKRHWEARAS